MTNIVRKWMNREDEIDGDKGDKKTTTFISISQCPQFFAVAICDRKMQVLAICDNL